LTAARRDTVFRALADPTRRAILDRLRRRERTAGELGAPFADSHSQPAISQHLRVLVDAGLVRATRSGRERVYTLEPAALKLAFDWLGHFAAFWTEKLDALGDFLDREDE
jgi:DNA-binding transcriptional ArsR family regulator